jgi:hypothetical protein
MSPEPSSARDTLCLSGDTNHRLTAAADLTRAGLSLTANPARHLEVGQSKSPRVP